MLRGYRFASTITLTLLLLAAGCATPVMPTGGPEDRVPPQLIGTEPETGAVNVRADRLTLEFTKHIDEGSLQRALAITPEFDVPPTVRMRGRTAVVEFPSDLRENTTYVVTLGTELRDLRNNRLPEPITLAFATGPQLDEGRLEGWVRDPATGAGLADVHLFAYVLPDDQAPLPDPRQRVPDYRTETSSQGAFRFEYLREVPFFVVAVRDLNRNRRADPGEPFAAPPDPRVVPSTGEEDAPIIPLYLTRVDTLRPEPLRVRVRSDSEFALRFTEPVALHDAEPADFAVTDSLAAAQVPVRFVYPDEDPYQIVLETDAMRANPHSVRLVRPEAVRDSVGNPATTQALRFIPGAPGDRPEAELARFEPAGSDTLRTLRPGEAAAVIFSRPPTAPPAAQRIEVFAPDGSPAEAVVEPIDGIRYAVRPIEPGPFSVRVAEPDSVHLMRFLSLPADSLGEVSGTVLGEFGDVPVIVELVKPDGYRLHSTIGPDSTFIIRNVPRGAYTLRVFVDEDGSGTWTGGRLAPYAPPEVLVLRRNVQVRARWETELDPISLDPTEMPAPTATPTPPPGIEDPEDIPEERRGFNGFP